MGAVDEVAEEGGAEVTAGVETSQDKVWMLILDVLLRTDAGAARVSRPLFSKVLRLNFQVQRFVDSIRTSEMFGGSEFLTAGSARSQSIILVDTIQRLQLFDEGLPRCPGVHPTGQMAGSRV